MFKKSRSKRANQNAHVQVLPTSAAAIAALQATGAQSIQDGRLAAGAAAAALRSHTSSPVNVGEVQTRRMVRRASITSATSDTSFQHGRPGVSRSDSISSMTSRTFRSPSPYGMKPVAEVQPPVPPISRSGATSPSSMTTRSFRRPASTEPVARTMSPTPAKNVRNMSVDAATRRASRPAAIATANLGYGSEKTNGSRNSVNFSRPMSPDNRPISPAPASPLSPAGRRSHRSGSVGSRDGADGSGYRYQEIANKPVKKKQGLGGDEGSHLAAGTMGIRATGTAVETGRPKRIPLPRRISEEPDEPDEEEEFEQVFDPHTRTMVKRRKPNWRPKAAAPPPQPPATATRAAPVATPTKPVKPTSPARSFPSAAAAATAAISLPPEPKARDVSASPARKARFSLRPEEHAIRHEPARSLTPTKSALRKSPSPRGLSPAESASKRASWNQPGFTPSEVSETASHLSDDRPKRKSVRVSFDDQPTIVGTSITPIAGTDSPTILSPQHDKKKGWFSLRKKTSATEENEERIAPIPTLPSFGSVRGRRPEAEEGQELIPGALGIPGVALTTGEQTPSEAGSHADEGEGKEQALVAHRTPLAENVQVEDAAEDIRGEDVPTIAIIPGTPGVDNGTKDPLVAANEERAPSSPVQDSSPAALGISEPEPEAAAAAHDPNLPVVGHVAETIKQQTDAGDKLETDSQDSHYSDAPEDVDGDGFGSINAIVESPVISPDSPDSPKKQLAEALPPLTDAPPTEITPVPAVEAVQGAEATTYREATMDSAVKEPLQHGSEREEVASSKADRPLPVETSPPQQKPQVESVSYNPRRVGSNRSSQDTGPDGPRRFVDSLASRSRPARSWSPDSDDEDGPLPQSSAYPAFQKSPRHSFQGEAGSGSASPNTPPTAATDAPSKRASIRETPASSPVSTNTPSSVGRPTTEKKPLKSALKQTNRPSVSPETLAASQPRGALQKKPRPVSVAASSSKAPSSEAVLLAQAMAKVQANRAKEAQAREADVQSISQRARAASLGAGSAPVSKRSSFIPPMPKLGRRGSDASDSSFRRGPASVTSEGGRVSMRRSMRANNSARPQSMVSSGSYRQAARSEQPPRSRPTSMIGGGGFSSRTMRPSREPSPTRSILSFRKSRRPASVQGSGSTKRMTSRFNDDSDDDDVMPHFASRFDDSDDDNKSTRLRPVRGIPRRTEEVDSSDLDSDADVPVSPRIKAASQEDRLLELARQRLGIEARPDVPAINQSDTRLSQADLVTAFAEKPNDSKESKRKSFFGALGRRKTQSKVKKDVEESIARRDTHLERTALQRNNTGQASLASTPERPKASRQTTAERAATLRREIDVDSWPLPESPTMAQRPETSDGSPPSTVIERPKPRRNVSADGSVLGRTGKKKRFPFLRKAFGLHD